jgi:hypothetical protein
MPSARKRTSLPRLVQAAHTVVYHFGLIPVDRSLDPDERAMLMALEDSLAPFIKEFRAIQES